MVLTRAKRAELIAEQEVILKSARAEFIKVVRSGPCPTAKIPQFTFLALVGKGGYGSVYKAKDETGNIVGVKVQTKEKLRKSRNGKTLSHNERVYLYALSSEFVAKCYSSWRSRNYVALVMDYSPYGDLLDLVSRVHLTEKKASYYVAQVVCALEYLHASNIVFADLKPDNCLVFPKGRLKLADFGFSQYAKANMRAFGGSVMYNAPEYYKHGLYSDLVDWWSCGGLTHMIVIRRFAYSDPDEDTALLIERLMAPEPLALNALEAANVTGELKDLIRKLLEKDPAKRLGAAPEGVDAIKNHLWFKEVDFAWVRSKDFILPDFDADAVEKQGDPLPDPDFLKNDEPEANDPNAADFGKY